MSASLGEGTSGRTLFAAPREGVPGSEPFRSGAEVLGLLRVVVARCVVDGLDRDRLIRAAVEWGFSQVEVARRVGVTQARVNQIVHEEVPVPPAGFSGASPLEIAQRFVVGGISRERAVDELGRWSYISRDRPDGIDDAWEPGPGTWADVEAAHRAGLISDDMYDEALDRYAGRSNDG